MAAMPTHRPERDSRKPRSIPCCQHPMRRRLFSARDQERDLPGTTENPKLSRFQQCWPSAGRRSPTPLNRPDRAEPPTPGDTPIVSACSAAVARQQRLDRLDSGTHKRCRQGRAPRPRPGGRDPDPRFGRAGRFQGEIRPSAAHSRASDPCADASHTGLRTCVYHRYAERSFRSQSVSARSCSSTSSSSEPADSYPT